MRCLHFRNIINCLKSRNYATLVLQAVIQVFSLFHVPDPDRLCNLTESAKLCNHTFLLWQLFLLFSHFLYFTPSAHCLFLLIACYLLFAIAVTQPLLIVTTIIVILEKPIYFVFNFVFILQEYNILQQCTILILFKI